MGFGFKKNKSGQHTEEAVAQNGGQAKKKRGHMSKVLRESVTESAIATFQESPNLKFEAPDGTRYLGWLLDTAVIGGLTEKDKKDEDKGSLIEAINHGAIDVMITPTLLDHEMICFIPSERTLDAMEEFPMLIGATYHPYTVPVPMGDRKCEGDLDRTMTFAEAKAVMAGTLSAGVLAGVEAPAPQAPTEVFEPIVVEEPAAEAPVAAEEFNLFGGDPLNVPVAPVESAPEPEIIEPEPTFDETPAWMQDSEFESYDFTSEPSYDEDVVIDETVDYDAADEEESLELADIEEAVAAGEEACNKTVNRIFYSGDLDIETPMDAFDAMFVVNNDFIPFPETYGDGWLADQLSEMARTANSELSRLHAENIRAARAEFIEQCGLLAQRVAKNLDTDNPETLFGEKRILIDDLMSEALAHRGEHVDRQRAEVEAEWNTSLENAAQEAADAARASYKRRYSEQHALELARVQDIVEESLRHQHGDAMRKLNDERRAMAAKMMEHGTSEILTMINAKYQIARDREDAAYQRQLDSIRDFTSNEKENELVRIRVLEEEQRQQTELVRTRNELNSKLESERREADQREDALKREIERLRTQAAEDAKMREAVYNKHVSELEDRMNDTELRARKADERAASIESSVEARHAQIHADDKAMVDRLQSEIDAMTKAVHRNTAIMIGLFIIALIAAFCFGAAVGGNIA